MQLKGLFGVMVLVAAVVVAAPAAIAQDARSNQRRAESVEEAFDRAYFRNGRDIFENRSISGQFNVILGPGALIRNSYIENVIARDLELIDEVYQDALARQNLSDPVLRTPDLPNPFNLSVLTLPATSASQVAPPLDIGIPPQPEPLQAAPTSPGPVRALW
jgi:hypothetical protein